MAGESPGRNASERSGGPESAKPRRPSPQPEGEGSTDRRSAADAAGRSGGGGGGERGQGEGDRSSKGRSPPRAAAKAAETGRSYNRRPREIGRRREGGGGARSSVEAG